MPKKISDYILKRAYKQYKKDHQDMYNIYDIFIDCCMNPDDYVENCQVYIEPLIQEERIKKLNRIIEK